MTEKIKVNSTYTPDKDAKGRFLGSMDIELPGVLRIEGEPNKSQAVEFRVSWIEGTGVRPTGINVLSLEGQEITSTDLRAVRAKELWRAAIVDHVSYFRQFSFEWEEKFSLRIRSDVHLPDDKLELVRLSGPVPSTLGYIADLYKFADAIGLPPVHYIQQVFAGENLQPLPRATVTKWVKRAKDEGIFDKQAFFEKRFNNGDD